MIQDMFYYKKFLFYILGNVYWTDHLQDVIEVVRANNSRYVVVHGDLEKPKSVVVHPVMG